MKTYIIETNSRDIAGNIYDTHRSKEYKSFAIAKSYLKEGLESKIIEKETKFVDGKKTVSEKIVFVNNKLTKEKAIAYFNEKAPKALREKGITTIEQYVFEFNKQERVVFIINGVYSIRYINPEAYNCFMRNQQFKTVLKGLRTSKKDVDEWIEFWLKRGMRLVEEVDEGEQKIEITELEAKLLNYIKDDFSGEFTESSVDEYLHYTKDFPIDPKQARGILATLKRKKVIDYCNEKGCWNPIYKAKNWDEALAIIKEGEQK